MDYDDAYENGGHIPGGDSYPPRWVAEARAFRATARAELDIPYGSEPRQKMDIFYPEGDIRGLMVFVHGGYWKARDRKDWSGFAAGGVARGWAVAMPSYTLAPEARISQITAEVAVAIDTAARKVAGPICLAGHSAGGHLVARMLCLDVRLTARDRIARCVPISPVSDLREMLKTSMNEDLRLDMAEAEAESPMLHRKASDAATTVWVGAAERPVFVQHAQWLAHAWDCPIEVVPERHHFDIIDGLADPESPLMQAILGSG
ncbi:alpha/beta hydrolase [Algirhabdus cladophorae]|uniref:alpha/beta hydrolase n=1 Tax=Algirhabdus cladophorae TaxID=3377108 RepID=UPI003B8494DC